MKAQWAGLCPRLGLEATSPRHRQKVHHAGDIVSRLLDSGLVLEWAATEGLRGAAGSQPSGSKFFPEPQAGQDLPTRPRRCPAWSGDATPNTLLVGGDL